MSTLAAVRRGNTGAGADQDGVAARIGQELGQRRIRRDGAHHHGGGVGGIDGGGGGAADQGDETGADAQRAARAEAGGAGAFGGTRDNDGVAAHVFVGVEVGAGVAGEPVGGAVVQRCVGRSRRARAPGCRCRPPARRRTGAGREAADGRASGGRRSRCAWPAPRRRLRGRTCRRGRSAHRPPPPACRRVDGGRPPPRPPRRAAGRARRRTARRRSHRHRPSVAGVSVFDRPPPQRSAIAAASPREPLARAQEADAHADALLPQQARRHKAVAAVVAGPADHGDRRALAGDRRWPHRQPRGRPPPSGRGPGDAGGNGQRGRRGPFPRRSAVHAHARRHLAKPRTLAGILRLDAPSTNAQSRSAEGSAERAYFIGICTYYRHIRPLLCGVVAL